MCVRLKFMFLSMVIPGPNSIVLKPCRPGGSTRGWNRAGLIKNRKSHDLMWPGRPGGLTWWPGQTQLQPVDFCFFYENDVVLNFFKIGIDPADPEPGPWTGPTTGSGLKTMPNSLGQNIDVFIRPLIDNLTQLQFSGVLIYDVSTNKIFLWRQFWYRLQWFFTL